MEAQNRKEEYKSKGRKVQACHEGGEAAHIE